MSGSLPDRLMAAVDRLPSKEAIIFGPRRVTYGELGMQVSSAAAAIRERVDKGSRVAVVMENSPEYVAACYGTWAAGAVLVGLSPALKTGKLAHLIGHSRAGCLLIDQRHPELSSLRERVSSSVRILEVDLGGGFPVEVGEDFPVEVGEGFPPEPGAAGGRRPDPASLAAIVYTSGTTGHPKGVMLSHGNLSANTESILRSLPIRPDDRAMCVLPFQYSYGASVLHTHLAMGATLVLERSFMYPHLALERMVEEEVTTLAGVPSTFRILLLRTDLSAYDLSTLRYSTVAGAPMGLEQISEFRDLAPGAEFFVMYGQTEASPRLTCLPTEELDRRAGSVGKAIPGVELRIRGEEGKGEEGGEGLPPGAIGEVCARGGNVFLGYWDDQEETEKVLKDGWLYTGDLGHLDAGGYLFLHGRLREMIKSGAHRIAPGEIEEVIWTISGVKDVVVTGVEDALLGEVPKAWVIPSQPDQALRRRILHECRTRLARFKVPKEVEFRTDFPRTSSGKVQRHLL